MLFDQDVARVAEIPNIPGLDHGHPLSYEYGTKKRKFSGCFCTGTYAACDFGRSVRSRCEAGSRPPVP
jgi:hypothetical protein